MQILSFLVRGAYIQAYCRQYLFQQFVKRYWHVQAKKVYISNLTTQAGETYRYTASEHVQALYDHAGEAFIDTVLLNEADFHIASVSEGMTGPPWPVENDIEMLATTRSECRSKRYCDIIGWQHICMNQKKSQNGLWNIWKMR